jgi:hypothetical protein
MALLSLKTFGVPVTSLVGQIVAYHEKNRLNFGGNKIIKMAKEAGADIFFDDAASVGGSAKKMSVKPKENCNFFTCHLTRRRSTPMSWCGTPKEPPHG